MRTRLHASTCWVLRKHTCTWQPPSLVIVSIWSCEVCHVTAIRTYVSLAGLLLCHEIIFPIICPMSYNMSTLRRPVLWSHSRFTTSTLYCVWAGVGHAQDVVLFRLRETVVCSESLMAEWPSIHMNSLTNKVWRNLIETLCSLWVLYQFRDRGYNGKDQCGHEAVLP